MATTGMNAVGWFEIYTDDISRAKKFYEGVFATTLEEAKNPSMDMPLEMWMFTHTAEGPGAGGAICKMEGVTAGGNSTMVYFSCEDCSVEESRIAEFGGKVVAPKFSIGEHGFISVCQDTEGNTIGLHSMK